MPRISKEMNSIYCKAHYRKFKEKYIERAKIRSLKYRTLAREFVLSVLASGCIDCGEKDILVLDFDHRDKKEKSFNIGGSFNMRSKSLEKIKAEIAKCDVRCANCHRRKTAKEMGSWRLMVLPSGIEPESSGPQPDALPLS